jgi:hypothetical protein
LEGFGVRECASAYGPIVEVLRSLLQSRAGANAIELSFRAHLAVLLPELGRPARAVDRATLFEVIRSLLARAPAQHPLAVVLDDLQWADEATLDLLPALARSLDGEPVLLLVAYRSDDVPRGTRSGGCAASCAAIADGARSRSSRSMRPRPFLKHVLGAAVAPSLRDAIFDRTDGVPFFVAELALALAASERLLAGPAGLELLDGDGTRRGVALRAARPTSGRSAASG